MMNLEKAKQRAFDTCNLYGDEVNVYSIMDRYKAIRDLPDDEYEEVYEEIIDKLGLKGW